MEEKTGVEVKDCPCCGNKATIRKSEEGDCRLWYYYIIECTECPLELEGRSYDKSTPEIDTKEKAEVLYMWNRRVK